ncbi:hypothetical protein DE4585_02544 [Mycobacteroides salmoniphilum]|uniref:Uncharacterized protein n=1 Tax=Mycobacteroides salmoniphilum TaxID=404941 RepID=A0A4R8S7A1_9MYCO|nr:hypothetical protein [Mycobacteroides salmoniphilum]TDZ82016.1 hypothetical protein DE4585_02544 [Mycobacteroides salmoniphilum]
MVMKDRWTMPAGLRRASALVAIIALAVGGAKVVDDNTAPGSGFSAVATVAADPTGPGGPTGEPGMDGGQQFQPPQMPSSMPDYQGGNNQPPMDQNSGISIYNTGAQGAPQQAGQQGGQQPQQPQQPQHGNQVPDYQTATPYTQGPGQANPDYQAPQQGNQPQQGQQPQQQQPNQQQPQNKQDDSTQQLDQKKQQCQAAAIKLAATSAPTAIPAVGGGGRSPIWWLEPGMDPTPTPTPPCPQGTDCAQKPPLQDQIDNLQKQFQDMARQHVEDSKKIADLQQQQIESNKKIADLQNQIDNPKCSVGQWMSSILGTVGGVGAVIAGALTAEVGIGVAVIGFGAVSAAGNLTQLSECIKNG